MQLELLPVVKSVTGGRPEHGYSGWRPKGIGVTWSGTTQNLGNATNHLRSTMDAFGLFTGQVGYAWNNASALREGRRCRHRQAV